MTRRCYFQNQPDHLTGIKMLPTNESDVFLFAVRTEFLQKTAVRRKCLFTMLFVRCVDISNKLLRHSLVSYII